MEQNKKNIRQTIDIGKTVFAVIINKPSYIGLRLAYTSRHHDSFHDRRLGKI